MGVSPSNDRYLQRRLDEMSAKTMALEKRIKQLERNEVPTIPIYDSANFPDDAVEGQIVIAPGTVVSGGGAAGPLNRARVWATEAIDVFTVTDASARVYPFNHGYTSDVSVFQIAYSGGSGVPSDVLRIKVMVSGVYAITYRFIAAAHGGGGGWDGTKLSVDMSDVAPDMWDAFHANNDYDGFGSVRTYITTFQNDPSFLPYPIYCNLSIPTGFPSLTFGSATYHTTHPEYNTGSYLEVTKLGDANTADWAYWFETAAGLYGPNP